MACLQGLANWDEDERRLPSVQSSLLDGPERSVSPARLAASLHPAAESLPPCLEVVPASGKSCNIQSRRAEEVYRPPWDDRTDATGTRGGLDDGYAGPPVRHADEDRWGSTSSARRQPFFRGSPGLHFLSATPEVCSVCLSEHGLHLPPLPCVTYIEPLSCYGMISCIFVQVLIGLAARTALEASFRPLLRTPRSFRRPHPPAPPSPRRRPHHAQKASQTVQMLVMWILSGKPSSRSWTALPRILRRYCICHPPSLNSRFCCLQL